MSFTAAIRRRWHFVTVPFLFLMLGVVFASWASRIPAIRDALQLDSVTLSMVLLCGGIGSVVAFPLASWMTTRFGARRSALSAGGVLLLSLPALAWAPQVAVLMMAGVLYGMASGCFDVAVNALGARMEKEAGRSIMALLHAWFCVGTLSGALLSSAAAEAGIAPLLHFSLVALLFVIPLGLVGWILPGDRPQQEQHAPIFAIPHGHLMVLGMIGFCGAIVEGTVADWSGLFMTDHLQSTDGVAPLAYAGFAGMMLISRLVGDRLKDTWGARKVVGSGALLGAIGIFIAVFTSAIPLAILGFSIAGAGVAMVFPFVFSAAGRHGPVALAGVATLSYSGGLMGPPAAGVLVHGWGLQTALAFTGILCCMVALSARYAKWLE